jgi:aminopeptidase N
MQKLKSLLRFFLCTFLSGLQYLAAQDHESRYKSIDVWDYSFRIELNDSTDVIRGEARLNILFLQKTDTLYLDLANVKSSGRGMVVDELRDKNGPVNYIHFSDKIRIPAPGIAENELKNYTIKYHGIPQDGLIISKNKFGDRTFFGDNWPDRAHQWLPCIDHPADKAKLDFTVVMPSHYQVIANGTCTEETLNNGLKTSRWKTTVPLSTKLMVIGVAKFAKQDLALISGIPLSTWVYPQNKNEGFSDYAVAIKPFVYFSNLIAPFPFTKLANVQSTTLYGGMENASCIFYAENSVSGKGRAEKLIAHEIAHQWFGDAVSEKDWYHIWLSEGFATYLTGMYIEQNYGRGAFLKHLDAEKKEVFDFEKLHLSPVIDTGLAISTDLLSPNTYQKAGWVLHMLRKELGDSLFIKCLQTFYKEYEYKNAMTVDFRNVVEKRSGRDFDKFFEQWLYKAGHPVLDITWTHQDHSLVINVKQLQDNTVYQFPLEIKIINKNSISSQIKVDVSAAEQSFTLNYPNYPIELIPDPGNWLLMECAVSKKDFKK